MRAAKEKRKRSGGSWNAVIVTAGVLEGGIGAAYLAARLNGVPFGYYLWPFMVCFDLFVFTTIGFFSTERGMEAVYLACSIASAVCGIIQLAVLF